MTTNRHTGSVRLSDQFLSKEMINSIQSGDLEKLIFLVQDENHSLDYSDKDGFFPIHLAVKYGHIPILEWLVKKKNCSIQKTIEYNQNISSTIYLKFLLKDPLDLAISFNQIDVIKWIVTEKDLHLNKPKKKQIINFAIKQGNIDFIRWLIGKDFSLNRSEIQSVRIKYSNNNQNSLFLAAKAGHLFIVKWLIEEHQFSLEMVGDNDFENVLHYMLFLGHLDIVQWLVDEKQYSLEEIDRNHSIIFLAIRSGHFELLKWLVDEKNFSLDILRDTYNVLTYSLLYAQFRISKWLVEEKKFSLDIKDSDGCNPLLMACANGSLETVKWLIEEKELSLNVDDGCNRVPVIQAILKGHFTILQYLVEEKHCSLDVKSSTHGTCPIHYAAIGGHFDILKWLVDVKKCSLETQNKHNQNILQIIYDICSFYERKEIIKWLIIEKNVFSIADFRNSMKDQYQECISSDEFICLYHMLINSVDEVEMNNTLNIIDKHLKITYANHWCAKLIEKTYEKAMTKFKAYSSPCYNLLLNRYCLINKFSLGHIQFLLEDNSTEKAMGLLFDLIHDDTIDAEVKKQAKINMAELLLQGNDFIEDNSPLSTDDSFLTFYNCQMKRVIQAFYLLDNIEDENSLRLKDRLENILSGNNKVILSPSRKGWLPKATEYYIAYTKYKTNVVSVKHDNATNLLEDSSVSPSRKQTLGGYTNYSCGLLFQQKTTDENRDDKEDNMFSPSSSGLRFAINKN